MGQLKYQFDDKRINARAQRCFERISERPSSQFPQVFSDSADLEGFYRLLHNPRVYLDALLNASVNETRSRIQGVEEDILVLHDTTEVKPPKSQSINEFQGDGKFLAHLSLLTSIFPDRVVYGAGDVSLWNRTKGYRTQFPDGVHFSNEEDRWWNHVMHVESSMPNRNLIHVMDREGDASKTWSRLQEAKCRFVVRLFQKRFVKIENQDWEIKIQEALKQAPVKARRVIEVSERKSDLPPRSKKRFPDRRARKAHVEISAASVGVHKTDQYNQSTAETLKVNIVLVSEKNRKKDPISWLLMTTEPIETSEDVLRVVDIYRSRWLMEEFFKGLKTGCYLEERLFADEGSWYRLFLFLLPLVTRILNLRNLNQKTYDVVLKENILTALQVKILNTCAAKKGRELKTSGQICLEIAHLGGHIKSNGPPGWLILLRGYLELLSLEKGWLLAQRKDVISP